MGDFYKSDPDETGIIRGASRILFSTEGDEWEDLGWAAEQVKVNYVTKPDDFDVDVPIAPIASDPIKLLSHWQMKIEAVMKPDSEWEKVINDIMAGKPRQISRYKMAVVYEMGDKDPFYTKPPRGLREILRWIWAGATYPWRLTMGQLEEPRRVLYVFHNLELVKPVPPIEIRHHFHFKDNLTPSLERMRWEMRFAMFRGGSR